MANISLASPYTVLEAVTSQKQISQGFGIKKKQLSKYLVKTPTSWQF